MVNPQRPDDNIEADESDVEAHGHVRQLIEDDDVEAHGPVRNLIEDDEDDVEAHGPVRN